MTTLRICFVGDSITNGTADDDFLGWPGRLCHAERESGHDVTLYNLGIRAETTAHILPRWRHECTPRLPDHSPGAIVFAFGINDMAEEDRSLRCLQADSLANARQMLTEALAWKPVLWIGPTPVDEAQQPFSPAPGVSYSFLNRRTDGLTRDYATLADELGVPFLDLFTPLAADDQFIATLRESDGVHPSANGYALMAERIAAWTPWRDWFDGR